MKTINATSPDDHALAIRTHPYLLVDYYKDDCPGCRMLELSLQRFAATPHAPEVVLLTVRMETVGAEFFRALGLRQTPTLSMFVDGAEVARMAGFRTPAQIATAVAAHIHTLEA